MNRETLDGLLIDRALAALSPATEELLDAYLAQNPQHETLATAFASTVRLAEVAVCGKSRTPVRLDPMTPSRSPGGFSALQIAASFVAGAAVAVMSVHPVLNRIGAPRISVADVAPTAPTSQERAIGKEPNVARRLPFWSNQRVYLLASRARELEPQTGR